MRCLAHIGFRLQRRLKWDPAREVFAADLEANRLRARAMREPWRMRGSDIPVIGAGTPAPRK